MTRLPLSTLGDRVRGALGLYKGNTARCREEVERCRQDRRKKKRNDFISICWGKECNDEIVLYLSAPRALSTTFSPLWGRSLVRSRHIYTYTTLFWERPAARENITGSVVGPSASASVRPATRDTRTYDAAAAAPRSIESSAPSECSTRGLTNRILGILFPTLIGVSIFSFRLTTLHCPSVHPCIFLARSSMKCLVRLSVRPFFLPLLSRSCCSQSSARSLARSLDFPSLADICTECAKRAVLESTRCALKSVDISTGRLPGDFVVMEV